MRESKCTCLCHITVLAILGGLEKAPQNAIKSGVAEFGGQNHKWDTLLQKCLFFWNGCWKGLSPSVMCKRCALPRTRFSFQQSTAIARKGCKLHKQELCRSSGLCFRLPQRCGSGWYVLLHVWFWVVGCLFFVFVFLCVLWFWWFCGCLLEFLVLSQMYKNTPVSNSLAPWGGFCVSVWV